MFVKRLFFASAAILCLAFAYHFGAGTATAQKNTGPSPVAGWFHAGSSDASGSLVLLDNGDVMFMQLTQGAGNLVVPTRWQKVGNILTP